MRKNEVLVIGGGAAGMAAAILATRNGAAVTIVEQKEALGKKILATGNGRCNFTNSHMDRTCFRSDSDPDVAVASILGRMGTIETLRFFSQLGVQLKERQGYYYPLTEQASTIVEVLKCEIDHLGIEVLLDAQVQRIENPSFHKFEVYINDFMLTCDSVILTTGGKAASHLGSNGSGYEFAKKLGHHIVPVVPALVALKGSGRFYKKLAGVRTEAKVEALVEHQVVSVDQGELQLTKYGISGIPVFQISRHISKALYEHREVEVRIDFLPSKTEEEFLLFLKERREQLGYRTIETYFLGILKDKLSAFFLYIAHLNPSDMASDLTDEALEKLVHIIKAFHVQIEDTNSFDEAQICAGGVDLSEIQEETLESKLVPGLYFAGEVLDVDGICGGYNLQWAWATGMIAGMEQKEKL